MPSAQLNINLRDQGRSTAHYPIATWPTHLPITKCDPGDQSDHQGQWQYSHEQEVNIHRRNGVDRTASPDPLTKLIDPFRKCGNGERRPSRTRDHERTGTGPSDRHPYFVAVHVPFARTMAST